MKILSFIILLKFVSNSVVNCYMLDINDILDESLMPGTLLLLEGNPSMNNITKRNEIKTIKDGSFINAFSTMGFHRKMINKYLCTNFIAEQILTDVQPLPIPSKLERRVGTLSKDIPENNEIKNSQPINDVKETMLFDQGSSGYKEWLAKTTTLEDVYKHYNKKKTVPNRRIMDPTRQQDLTDEDYEVGEVTGYAVHQPIQTQPNIHHSLMEVGGGQFENFGDYGSYAQHATAGSKTVDADSSHGLYYPPPAPIFPPTYGQTYYVPADDAENHHNIMHHKLVYHHETKPNDHRHDVVEEHGYNYPAPAVDHGSYEIHEEEKGGMTKEMELKDIFEIALTTLAFLSFGMFILQVLMCITMTKTDNNMMMMQLDDEGDINGPEVRRKRSASGPSIVQINEITRKVLKSIDAVMDAQKDNGTCLHRTLCENNKFARNRSDGQRIWIPVWGLGISWLSSKLTNHPNSILESLKASTLGLGNADCLKLYSSCTK